MYKKLSYYKKSLKYNSKYKFYYFFLFYKQNRFCFYNKYFVKKYKSQYQSYFLYIILFEQNRQEKYNKYNYCIRNIKNFDLQVQKKTLNYRKTIFNKLYKLQKIYRSKYR